MNIILLIISIITGLFGSFVGIGIIITSSGFVVFLGLFAIVVSLYTLIVVPREIIGDIRHERYCLKQWREDIKKRREKEDRLQNRNNYEQH